jgi:hypothetical protein
VKKILAGIADLIGRDIVIRVERKRIDKGYMDGFAVGMSDDLLLLHLVEGSTLMLNGYAALRLRDISFWRVDETFVTRALRLLERRPSAPDGIDLADWPALIASAQRLYPLLMIEMEKKIPGCGYIGRLIKQTKRHIVLNEVNPEGHWEAKKTWFPRSDITQVEFGDGYTETLATLVAHETAAY